jgi:hypothetical protein
MVTDDIGVFVNPVRIFSRQDVLADPSPVPAQDGIYGWWFRQLPPLVKASGYCQHQGLMLLYVGISPDQPPRNGQPPSKRNLGCLLADELGIQLRRVGSGDRTTFVAGEQKLSAWMAENAYVSWVTRSRPWELEDYLIAALDLPLNIEGNSRNQFYPVLRAARARCMAQARVLPIMPNPGSGGR